MVLIPFLSELSENKEFLLKTFLSDQELVDLVSGKKGHAIPATDLRYTQVYPVAWVDGTVSEAKTFVCFDIDVNSVSNIAVKNCDIFIWIFTHKKFIFTQNGILIDLIASRVDELINGSTELGFGKVKLETALRWSPNSDYYGRVLKYSVQDWNRFGARL
ncbi:MAG: hypothetical protein RR365_01010 [Bacteroides sp.]